MNHKHSQIEESLLKTPEEEELNYDYFRSKLEKRRWIILLAFSLISFMNAAGWVAYSPILSQS